MAWGSSARDADYQQRRDAATNNTNLFRFFLKEGEKRKVIFLADERFCVYEHMIQVGPAKWEKFTCSDDANCYFCGTKKGRTFTEYSSILDVTPYTTSKGEKRRFSRKPFGATGAAIDIIDRRRQEKGGSLEGYGVECFRDTGKTPSVGNDFTVSNEKIDLKKHFPEAKPEFDFKPFDFRKVLAPKRPEEVQAFLRFSGVNPAVMSRSEMMNQADQDMSMSEDIPF